MRGLGLALIVMMMLATACGSGETTSGWGSPETNTIVSPSLSIQNSSSAIDACLATDTPMLANISTTVINPALPPNTLRVDQYMVTYIALTSGAPALSTGTYQAGWTLPAAGLQLAFISPTLKQNFRTAAAEGTASYQYSARYVFTGTDLYGSYFSASAEVPFALMRSSFCGVVLSASASVVNGSANPDVTGDDNILFSVSGGTGPYRVFSDRMDIISVPATLNATSPSFPSFSADVNSVASETAVTVSVLDANSYGDSAVITVRP